MTTNVVIVSEDSHKQNMNSATANQYFLCVEIPLNQMRHVVRELV